MNKILKKINSTKQDKSSYFQYIKCFANNVKANELFIGNKSFNSLKKYVNNKKN